MRTGTNGKHNNEHNQKNCKKSATNDNDERKIKENQAQKKIAQSHFEQNRTQK